MTIEQLREAIYRALIRSDQCVLIFPMWLWTWIVIIAIIKIGNVVWGLIAYKRLISLHTISNKVTGFLLFLLPLTFGFLEPIYSSAAVCFMATLSAINELYYTRIGKEIF